MKMAKFDDDEWEELLKLDKDRRDLHENHQSSRPLSKNYELLGLMGELAFEKCYGYLMDRSPRRRGDNGIDFTNRKGETIDVKTADKPYNLLVEATKIDSGADIYVLAWGNIEKRTVHFLGWVRRGRMRATPIKDIGGFGILSHYLAGGRLDPMP